MALVLPCVTCGRTFALSPIMTASLVAMPHCSQMCSSAAAAGRGTHALRSSSHDEHGKTASGTCGGFSAAAELRTGRGLPGAPVAVDGRVERCVREVVRVEVAHGA